jgi:aminoglycoside phosphotransferase
LPIAGGTLAVATRSLGEGLEDEFLRAYGIARDEDRIRFYRLLYDLVP